MRLAASIVTEEVKDGLDRSRAAVKGWVFNKSIESLGSHQILLRFAWRGCSGPSTRSAWPRCSFHCGLVTNDHDAKIRATQSWPELWAHETVIYDCLWLCSSGNSTNWVAHRKNRRIYDRKPAGGRFSLQITRKIDDSILHGSLCLESLNLESNHLMKEWFWHEKQGVLFWANLCGDLCGCSWSSNCPTVHRNLLCVYLFVVLCTISL